MFDDPDHFNDLDTALDTAWRMLVAGARDRHSAAHTPTLVTVDQNGLPEARTVVLRDCDAETRTLVFHTDCRSAKYAELLREPRAAMHSYDAAAKIQLRLGLNTSLHQDDALADGRWAASAAMSKVCYQVTAPPGTPVSDPRAVVFDDQAGHAGRDYFVAVAARIDSIEWLYLSAAGHRRARFEWHNDTFTRSWLVP